jgi:hypothetical protein
MKITLQQLRNLIRESLSQDDVNPGMTAAERIMQKIRSQPPRPWQTPEGQLEALAKRVHKGYPAHGGQRAGPLDWEAQSIVKEFDQLTYPDSLVHAGFIMIPTPSEPMRSSSWFHKDSKVGVDAIEGSRYHEGLGINHFKVLAAEKSHGRIPVEMDGHPYDAPENPAYKQRKRPSYY